MGYPLGDFEASIPRGLIRLVERLEEGGVPTAETRRLIFSGRSEQSQDRRRASKIGVKVDVRQSRHGHIVCLLLQRAALCTTGVDDGEDGKEIANCIRGECRRFGSSVAWDEMAIACPGLRARVDVVPDAHWPGLRTLAESANLCRRRIAEKPAIPRAPGIENPIRLGGRDDDEVRLTWRAGERCAGG